MKTIFAFLVGLFLVSEATAQLNQNPNNFNYYYLYHLTNGSSSLRAYTANTTDTLPNSAKNFWYSSNPTAVPAGGSFQGLRVLVSDSAYMYIYVDAKDGATWTNSVYTDSIEVDNSDTVEVLLRGVATERLGGRLAGTLRFRINFQNVTQGTTSATYRADYLWKP